MLNDFNGMEFENHTFIGSYIGFGSIIEHIYIDGTQYE